MARVQKVLDAAKLGADRLAVQRAVRDVFAASVSLAATPSGGRQFQEKLDAAVAEGLPQVEYLRRILVEAEKLRAVEDAEKTRLGREEDWAAVGFGEDSGWPREGFHSAAQAASFRDAGFSAAEAIDYVGRGIYDGDSARAHELKLKQRWADSGFVKPWDGKRWTPEDARFWAVQGFTEAAATARRYGKGDADPLTALDNMLREAAGRRVASLLPRDSYLNEYYKATERKHFDPSQPGSTFTRVKSLEDLIALAAAQRGNLDGDDREALKAIGAPDSAFRPGIRYLMVETPGTVGVVPTGDLPGDTVVGVEQKHSTTGCSVILEVDEEPETSVGTIIIGAEPDHGEVVYTAHPGFPVPSAPPPESDPLMAFRGLRMTLDEVRAVVGSRELWANTVRR